MDIHFGFLIHREKNEITATVVFDSVAAIQLKIIEKTTHTYIGPFQTRCNDLSFFRVYELNYPVFHYLPNFPLTKVTYPWCKICLRFFYCIFFSSNNAKNHIKDSWK